MPYREKLSIIIQSAYSFSSNHRSTRDRERTANMNRDTFAASEIHPPTVSAYEGLCGSQLNSPVNFSTDY